MERGGSKTHPRPASMAPDQNIVLKTLVHGHDGGFVIQDKRVVVTINSYSTQTLKKKRQQNKQLTLLSVPVLHTLV